MNRQAVEVIQHIFYFLSPCEIVRLRQVSKQFRDITHNSVLWRDIYANARLLLPPGPISLQSTQCLERTLVQSELVSKTWTSQPLKALSHTLSSWKRGDDDLWTVVFGRWCIFLQEKTVQCHDIDTDTHHTLYDGTAHPNFRFMAGTGAGVNGKRVYLLLADYNYQHELIKLLEFCVDNDGFSEPEIMDLAHIGLESFDTWRSTGDLDDSAPLLVVRRRQPCVVLDFRTRCLHTLLAPKFPSDLANESRIRSTLPGSWYNASTEVVLTRTHIIAVQTNRQSSDVHVLIQAFVAPDSAILRDRIEVGELRLTHEVAISTASRSISLLRNSIVDPVTGSVNIRLRTTTIQTSGEQMHMSCLDLTLPKPVSTSDVLSISVRSQHLFEFTRSSQRYTASDDGYVRGLLLIYSGPPDFHAISARKFTIDASKEECTAAISDPCPVDLPMEEDEVAFDGTRGRIHYFQVANNAYQVVTVDLA